MQSRYYDPVTCKFINIDEPAILFETAFNPLSVHLWSYCDGNPVMYVDYTGAKKSKLAILTIEQFYNESREIKKLLSKIFPSNSTMLYQYNGSSSFINMWNELSGYDVIVINSHGSPDHITYVGRKLLYSSSNKLKVKNIKCKLLIILGCNCGHYNTRKANIAYYFSQKITGVVVASDGTVYSSQSKGTLIFKSKTDDTYLSYCGKQTRPNKGWLIYQYINKKGYVWTTPYKNLELKQFITYLKMIKKF